MSSQVEKLIINATSLDTEKDIKYSKPKINKSGGKSINIQSCKTNTVLNLSTPLMLTWGVNEYIDEKTGRVSYDLALQFPNEEYAKENTTNFLNNMRVFFFK